MTTTLPAGIERDAAGVYWIRADYFLYRVHGGWELTDCIKYEDRFFRTEAAGLAALVALV